MHSPSVNIANGDPGWPKAGARAKARATTLTASMALSTRGQSGLAIGAWGAVQATVGGAGRDFAINGPILAPGYGEQGGTAADIVALALEPVAEVTAAA